MASRGISKIKNVGVKIVKGSYSLNLAKNCIIKTFDSQFSVHTQSK